MAGFGLLMIMLLVTNLREAHIELWRKVETIFIQCSSQKCLMPTFGGRLLLLEDNS